MTCVLEESGSGGDSSALPTSFYSLWKSLRVWMIENGSLLHLDISRVMCSCCGTTCTANVGSTDHTGLVQTEVWSRGVVPCYALRMVVNATCPGNVQG